MRHLVIGQRQKAPNFSAFHWSPHGCLITIGQHFITTRVIHLPKRTETSLITESDQSRANHQLLQLCTVRTAWSDQAVRAVHSCKSRLFSTVCTTYESGSMTSSLEHSEKRKKDDLLRSEGRSQYTHKWPCSPKQAYHESSFPGISNPLAGTDISIQFFPDC